MSGQARGDPKLNGSEDLTPSLVKGNILTRPIGYIESCFSAKNGTPRQPSVCGLSRACLRINKSVFNNPEHSLMGLDQFSHVWILFVFHQNGQLSCKAKVKPPRLNGAKTGVFSTRSPHRPNAIGLTLAKLVKVEGGTIFLSGIDMIQGTPVLDIKPYIADYDCPHNERLSQMEPGRSSPVAESPAVENKDANLTHGNRDHIYPIEKYVFDPTKCIVPEVFNETCFKDKLSLEQESKPKCDESKGNLPEISKTLNSYLSALVTKTDPLQGEVLNGTSTSTGDDSLDLRPTQKSAMSGNITSSAISVASWVSESPVATLQVRFTPHSELDLQAFKAANNRESEKTPFKYFQSPEEAKCAITTLLAADPRSVYRRKHCEDRLFYFTLDTAHITCWFGEGFAEVLRIKALDSVEAR